MSLSKLSIFAKDTDASETIKGYEYQKLRTIETWLHSYLNQKDQIIYCDYEEDIFLRDQSSWVTKFIQIKLYSSKNFSFSSIEITKAISHFFMLFIKGEYKFDEIEFAFETNVAIAAKYGDNDADLLKEWKNNQGNLSTELLSRCVAKIKAIIKKYVEPFGEKVKDEVLLEKIAGAKIVLDEVPDEVWGNFVKSITWSFAEISADQAVDNTIKNIYELIEISGFASAKTDKEGVFNSLYYLVSERSMDSETENRKLNTKLMDSALLNAGDKDDKWYQKDYQTWVEVSEINYFSASEFYQLIHSGNYCRRKIYLKHHSDIWVVLLQKYIVLPTIPEHYKRKAIYELAWLKFPLKRFTVPEGSLKGLEDLLRVYYADLKKFKDHTDVEDALNLLGVIKGAIAFDEVDLNEDELDTWETWVDEVVRSGLENASNDTESCYFHELAAGLIMQHATEADQKLIEEMFIHLDAILASSENAVMHDVVRLSNRINAYIKVLVHHKADIELIERLENFSDKLMPIANKKTEISQLLKYIPIAVLNI